MLSLNGARSGPTIAVDAMGGDHAPEEVVKGALEAHRRGARVVLAGPPDRLKPMLNQLGGTLPIAPASEAIGMDEPVVQALRREDSSLHAAARLVSTREAQGAVSCGNSAAIMGVALRLLGTQAGIARPAFGSTIPTRHGGCFALDIGAYPGAKAVHLTQFAVMGEVYVRLSLGLESPRVALLSNGTEDSKGTKVIREANEALRKLDMNFVGNVEATQIFEGITDVVVCDGFTGNIFLKCAEAVALEIFDLLKSEISHDLLARAGAVAMLPAFKRIRKRVDYEEVGGAPVLGVNGVMINCHGRSKAKAVTSGILLADRMAREGLVDQIGHALQHDELEAGRRRRLTRALLLRHE